MNKRKRETDIRSNYSTYFNSSRLNQEQKKIFDFVHLNKNNPEGNIVLIQAGPGTGKTFTMLSLTVSWPKEVNVIIFKNDLLNIFNKCNAKCYSVTKFLMKAFNMDYMQYKFFEIMLNKNINAYDFINGFFGLLKNFKLQFDSTKLYIFDEYTFISKPILLIILIHLKINKCNAIFCGDKNQLQSIRKCNNLLSSSYDIIYYFANNIYILNKNERCNDTEFDEEIKYIAKFVNDDKMSKHPFINILCSNLFHDKLIKHSSITDTVLGFHHRTVAQEIHSWFMDKKPIRTGTNSHCSFYYIISKNSQDKVNGTQIENSHVFIPHVWSRYIKNEGRVENFLPYIPLIEGNSYFYEELSENNVVTLIEILNENEIIIELQNKKKITISKTKCDNVTFERHKEFILGQGGKGYLYNFNLYPTFFMSIHMSQGRTIKNTVTIMLEDATIRALYVAISRVKDKSQINRISLPNSLFLIVSTIYNYPSLCESNKISLSEIIHKLEIDGYYYLSCDNILNQNEILNAVTTFYSNSDVETRNKTRTNLCKLIQNWKSDIIYNKEINSDDSDVLMSCLHFLLQNWKIFHKLMTIDEKDAFIWLKLYLNICPDIRNIIKVNEYPNIDRNNMNSFLLVSRLLYSCPQDISIKEYVAQRSLIPDYYTKLINIDGLNLVVSEFQSEIINYDLSDITLEYLNKALTSLPSVRSTVI